MPPARNARDLESVSELKFGQIGIANLRIKQLDAHALENELSEKVRGAPKLFARAPVVVDLSQLPSLPERAVASDLLACIRRAGFMPVGLSYGTRENEELAKALNLPVLAKFRVAYERPDHTSDTSSASVDPPQPGSEPAPTSRSPAAATIGLIHDKPVRSGQQIYARGRDLVLTRLVGNGSEVIADGSIHVYGALRGRALAGAQGDTAARIYCQQFHAELISIAGHYRVFEDMPAELRGRPVQAWLDGDKLLLANL
ncbi:MAG: septum site-determining protein MinC [Rhodanobacteraceae bacterium]